MLGNKEIYCTTGENMLFLSTFSTDYWESDDATDAATVSQNHNQTVDSDPMPAGWWQCSNTTLPN